MEVRVILRTPSSIPENFSDSPGVTASRAPMFVAELIHTVELRLCVLEWAGGHGIQHGTGWCWWLAIGRPPGSILQVHL